MDCVAKDMLTHIGDSLGRTHAVRGGQLFCFTLRRGLFHAEVLSLARPLFAVRIHEVGYPFFTLCILAAINYRLRAKFPRGERETSYTTFDVVFMSVLNASYVTFDLNKILLF